MYIINTFYQSLFNHLLTSWTQFDWQSTTQLDVKVQEKYCTPKWKHQFQIWQIVCSGQLIVFKHLWVSKPCLNGWQTSSLTILINSISMDYQMLTTSLRIEVFAMLASEALLRHVCQFAKNSNANAIKLSLNLWW